MKRTRELKRTCELKRTLHTQTHVTRSTLEKKMDAESLATFFDQTQGLVAQSERQYGVANIRYTESRDLKLP